ncbi:hypothetical protein NP233_g12472 [Leucocoprinus birnbaumii]|uniref:Glutamine amidotransferase domain-containing protein n=1 Tax=Leucocoprinus birnbaumii TaxID=56174 RepID=A0AAD5VEM4_9AGAR|nr:hypothetical protein NP233_g12472 [Leucocoprinus birnbaumii]
MPRLAFPLRTVRVALLTCGELPEKLLENHGDLLSIYRRWLRNSLPRHSGTQLVMHGFDVAGMRFPEDSALAKCDAVMIAGSPADAGSDEAWTKRLVSFVQHVSEEHPQIKMYGICFGHQIVNRALGGTVQRNAQGWELGRTTVHTTDVGRLLFGVDKMEIQQVHQDHVPLSSLSSSLTPGSSIYSLGRTDNTDNHGLVKFHSHSLNLADSNLHADRAASQLSKHIHIMTIQGHPEFYDTLVTDIKREVHGMSSNVVESSERHSGEQGTFKNDGVNVIGKAFWRMFGC